MGPKRGLGVAETQPESMAQSSNKACDWANSFLGVGIEVLVRKSEVRLVIRVRTEYWCG